MRPNQQEWHPCRNGRNTHHHLLLSLHSNGSSRVARHAWRNVTPSPKSEAVVMTINGVRFQKGAVVARIPGPLRCRGKGPTGHCTGPTGREGSGDRAAGSGNVRGFGATVGVLPVLSPPVPDDFGERYAVREQPVTTADVAVGVAPADEHKDQPLGPGAEAALECERENGVAAQVQGDACDGDPRRVAPAGRLRADRRRHGSVRFVRSDRACGSPCRPWSR